MSALETIIITGLVVAIVLAPKALDTWLSLRDAARTSRDEWQLERVAGGAE